MTHPKRSFESMPTVGGFIEPLKFCGLMLLVLAINQTILKQDPLFICLWPVAVAIQFIMAGFLYVFAKMVGGKGTYEGTFRAVAYANFITLVTWIPFVGGLFQFYGIAMIAFGLTRAHDISNRKAVLIQVIPLSIIFGIAIISGFLVGYARKHG